MTREQVVFEFIKLALQFGAAIFIAWRTVQWALARYKAEKYWERRLSAYTELLAALGVLQQVLGVWEQSEVLDRKASGEDDADIRARYWVARRQLEEARSVALLLLPSEVGSTLYQLIRDLSREGHTSFFDKVIDEGGHVAEARNEIVRIGRKDLGIRPQRVPPRRKNDSSSSSNA